jgi:hypothetical protein
MYALIELAFFVLLLPLLIIGAFFAVIGTAVGNLIARTFEPRLLALSVSVFGFSWLTWLNMNPAPQTPWLTLVESLAQVHVLGLPIAYLSAVLGGFTLIASVLVAAGKRPA